MHPRLEAILGRVSAINQRVDWIAKEEARSAQFGGKAAEGYFTAEKEKLIAETDELLLKAQKLLGMV